MKVLYIFLLLILSIEARESSYIASLQYEFSDSQNVIEKGTFTPNHQVFACGDWDGDIYLYSLSGIKKGELKAHQQKITGLNFITNNHLLSSSLDKTIRLWDLKQQKEVYCFNNNSPIICMSISLDGEKLVSVDQNSQIKIIHVKKRRVITEIKVLSQITHIQFFEDTIIIANRGQVLAVDLQGNILFKFPNYKNTRCLEVRDKYLIIAGDKYLNIWNIKQQKLIETKSFPRSIQSACFGKNNEILVHSGGNIFAAKIGSTSKILLKNVYFYHIVCSSKGEYFLGLGDKKIYVHALLENSKNIHFVDDINTYVDKRLRKEEIRPPLSPGILLLPFTDQHGATTELGITLAMVAMFYATYSPDKVLDIPFGEVEKAFCENQLLLPKQKISDATITMLQKQFNFTNTVKGNIISSDNGYQLTLNCQGNISSKQYKRFFTLSQLSEISTWVVYCIYEYFNISISDKRKFFWNHQKTKDPESILDISRIYPLYHASRYSADINICKSLAEKEPEYLFFLIQYGYSSFGDHNKPIENLLYWKTKYGDHHYVDLLLANFYFNTKQLIKALTIYLDLLFKDVKNPHIYKSIMAILQQKKDWETPKTLLLFCRAHIDDLYWYNVLVGEYYINDAWEVLPSANGKTKFTAKMTKAEKFLQTAYKQNNYRWEAPALMIKICMGLKKTTTEMEKWFQNGVKYHPHKEECYWQKFNYLTPRWYGSTEEMLKFTRNIAQNTLPSSSIRFLLLNAHREAIPGDTYYQNSQIWNDIELVFEPYLKVYPRDCVRRIWYWEYAMLAEKYHIAAKQYLYFENYNQKEILEEGVAYKQKKKAPLYFAVADIYMEQNNPQKALFWLEKGLHIETFKWEYQKIYTSLLLQNKEYEKAFEHLKQMQKSSNEQIIAYAKQKLTKITKKIIYDKESDYQSSGKIYLVRSEDVPKTNLSIIQTIIQNIYRVDVVILPKPYLYDKNTLIPDKTYKIKQILQNLYRVLGKNKVEAYRGIYNLGKKIKDDQTLLHNILERTNQGKNILTDLEQNYSDRWDTSSILKQLSLQYEKEINDKKSLGVLLIVNEEIGSLEKGYKLADGSKNVGIISTYRLKNNVSKDILTTRLQKLVQYTIDKITSKDNCAVPYCPCTYATNLFTLDNQNKMFCSKAFHSIKTKYD